MAIAKGQSNIKCERDLVILGFGEQIGILKTAQYRQEAIIKAQLFDNTSDSTIDNEEKMSIDKPLLEELQKIQECHLRIRRTILIGIYTLWELSLKAIVELKHAKADGSNQIRIIKDKKKSIAWNYLNVIYEGNIPLSALDIDGSVRILRNHMVHGNLSKDQLDQLRRFSICHSELYLKILTGECYFSDYEGLINLLKIISCELNNAEVTICK